MLENDTNLQVFRYILVSVGRGISVLLVPATLLLILHVPVFFLAGEAYPVHISFHISIASSKSFSRPHFYFPFLHFFISISSFLFPISVSHFHFLRSWFCHYPSEGPGLESWLELNFSLISWSGVLSLQRHVGCSHLNPLMHVQKTLNTQEYTRIYLRFCSQTYTSSLHVACESMPLWVYNTIIYSMSDY